MPGRRPTLLREARCRLGLTQAQVAEQIGVHVRTYLEWEAGRATPRHEHLVALADLLDISLADLDGIDD